MNTKIHIIQHCYKENDTSPVRGGSGVVSKKMSMQFQHDFLSNIGALLVHIKLTLCLVTYLAKRKRLLFFSLEKSLSLGQSTTR